LGLAGGSPNLYAYAGNSPAMLRDLLGLYSHGVQDEPWFFKDGKRRAEEYHHAHPNAGEKQRQIGEESCHAAGEAPVSSDYLELADDLESDIGRMNYPPWMKSEAPLRRAAIAGLRRGDRTDYDGYIAYGRGHLGFAVGAGNLLVGGVGSARPLAKVMTDAQRRGHAFLQRVADAHKGTPFVTEGSEGLAFGHGSVGAAEAPKARLRHYTNAKGLEGIQESGVILAKDQGKVFFESARKRPLSPHDAQDTYGIKRGRGRNYIETDVYQYQAEKVYNPKFQVEEFTIKGNVDLDNPTFMKR